MSLKTTLAFVEDAAMAEAAATRDALTNAETSFEGDRLIVRRLGGRLEGDVAVFGFWTPELLDARVPSGDIFLEVLRPRDAIDLTRAHQEVAFDRAYIPVIREEAYCFSAVEGMRAGTREAVGDFYALTWRDAEDQWHRILDPLAMSLPFGAIRPRRRCTTWRRCRRRGGMRTISRRSAGRSRTSSDRPPTSFRFTSPPPRQAARSRA
jgi:hypothetical protein